MLKNHELIYKMSVEQKIELIVSSKERSNHSVGSYEFPTFNLNKNPLEGSKESHATFFPTDKALASTFNPALICEIYNLKGIETKANLDTPFYNVTNNLDEENISNNHFLTGKFLSAKVKGLNSCGALINYEKVEVEGDVHHVKETEKFFHDDIIRGSYFKSVLVKNEQELAEYRAYNQNNEHFFAHANSKEEVLNLLSLGCCLVYVKEEILEETITFISECVYKHKEISKELENNKITKIEFEQYCNDNKVFSERALDNACDALMTILVDLSNCKRTISEQYKKVINDGHQPLYNEVAHDKKALEAAYETIVLLKNKKLLPLAYKNKVAIIGEYAKNLDLAHFGFKNIATSNILAYETVNDYDIQTTGFAYGYQTGEVENEQTVNVAVSLAKESDVSLVFLYAKENETTLPQEQLELIDALYAANAKIIAVVVAHNAIDITFDDKCAAVFFTYNSGQQLSNALYNILIGLENPSAKLIDDLYAETEDRKDIRYPFGHGLSYSTFEYHNMAVNDQYVSCTITNTSEYDGYVTPQLYVIKEDSKSTLGQTQLKGFNKVFVRANESVKIEIPFDNNTFKAYDPRRERYCIEGGQYRLILADSSFDCRLKGTINLAKFVYNDDSFVNEALETSNDFESVMKAFANTEHKQEYIKEGKGAPFALKLVLAILVAVYFNIVIVALGIGSLNSNAGPIGFIVLFLCSVAVNLFVSLYIAKISKKKVRFSRLTKNDTLTAVVEGIKEFKEIEKTVYKEPISEEQVEEETPVEEITAEEAPEEVKEVTYQSNFEEADDVLFKENLTLPELCVNFRDYALTKGLTVEPSSVRAIFAAIAASKIIFLDIKNKDLLPKFLETLNEYFSGSGVLTADETFEKEFNLLWKQEDDKYVVSEFVKSIKAAEGDKNRTSVAILNNVVIDKFYKYFNTFINYALHPTEEHQLKLNEEMTIKLPNNISYFVVPSESDYLEKFNKDLAKASISIEVIIGRNEEEHEEVEIKSISQPDLLALIREAKELHYLDEAIWKRIDEFVATINLTEKFGFGNKNILQLERYTSTLIECGGDAQEAFTSAFVSKIVPVLKTLRSYKKENGDRTIFSIIEKIFAEEDLGKIQKTFMKKI